MRALGLGFSILDWGLGVKSLGFMICSLGYRIQGQYFKVEVRLSRIKDVGLRDNGLDCVF